MMLSQENPDKAHETGFTNSSMKLLSSMDLDTSVLKCPLTSSFEDHSDPRKIGRTFY